MTDQDHSAHDDSAHEDAGAQGTGDEKDSAAAAGSESVEEGKAAEDAAEDAVVDDGN